MRAEIEIDDRLIADAMAASGSATPGDAVEAGLRLLARRKRQAAMRQLFGAVEWGGDLDADRRDALPQGGS